MHPPFDFFAFRECLTQVFKLNLTFYKMWKETLFN